MIIGKRLKVALRAVRISNFITQCVIVNKDTKWLQEGDDFIGQLVDCGWIKRRSLLLPGGLNVRLLSVSIVALIARRWCIVQQTTRLTTNLSDDRLAAASPSMCGSTVVATLCRVSASTSAVV